MIDGAALTSANTLSLCSGQAMVVVAPDAGGAIASYRWTIAGRSLDWLRPATERALQAGLVEGMGCFPLFPYSNRVRDGRFVFGERMVALPTQPGVDPHAEHGHGWRSAWSAQRLAPDEVLLRYEHAPDAWPWAYAAEQRIALSEAALTITLAIVNRSAETMPCGFGLHPYFPRSRDVSFAAKVDGMWETDAEVLPVALARCAIGRDPAVGLRIADVDFDNPFAGWDGRARIDWPDQKRALTIEADPLLRALVLYTPPAEDFFCVEPVSNVTDAFNLAAAGRDDTGLVILGPGERREAAVRLIPHFEALNP